MKSERPNYFLFGIQRTCTNLVEWLIGRNFEDSYCVTREWYKHDINPPMPSGLGFKDYVDLIENYDFPVIHCYKPLDWWVNSMLNHNVVTRELLHREIFLRQLVEPEDLDKQKDPELYIEAQCSEMFREKDPETNISKLVCGNVTQLAFQNEMEEGLNFRKTIHKSEKYYLHLDLLIDYWVYYHREWKDNLTKLKKIGKPTLMVNWDDIRKEGGQARFMKDLIQGKYMNSEVNDLSKVVLVGDQEDVTPKEQGEFWWKEKPNPYNNRSKKYESNDRYNLTDIQVDYLNKKVPKTLVKFFEK